MTWTGVHFLFIVWLVLEDALSGCYMWCIPPTNKRKKEEGYFICLNKTKDLERDVNPTFPSHSI